MVLAELAHGESAVIVEVGGEGSFRRRLMELGFVPGTCIERSGRAPLGDPVAYRLRGSVISLRRSDAQNIQVKRP